MPFDPMDPFASPVRRPPPSPLIQPPVQWHVRDDVYWIADGDLVHPISVMPLGRAHRLVADLTEQAQTDLVAAFRDLPLLAALRHHIARLTAEGQA